MQCVWFKNGMEFQALLFFTPGISNSFSRDCCTKQDLSVRAQLHRTELPHTGPISLKVVLIKENKKEHQPLSYTITSGETQGCQLELTPDPGVVVKQSTVLIQTWGKSLIQSSDAFLLRHTRSPSSLAGSKGNIPCSSPQIMLYLKMPAGAVLMKDRHLIAGWSHAPGAAIVLLAEITCWKHTKPSINANYDYLYYRQS